MDLRDPKGPHSRAYDASILDERPNSSDAFYEIPDSRPLSMTSVLVRIAPYGSSRWIGRFLSRDVAGDHRRAIYATGDPHRLAVMVNLSVVYWIDVRNPASWKAPDLGYVEDALFDAQRDRVIVSSFNMVRAIDSDGAVLWEVRDDGFDGMQLTGIEGSTLRGIGDSIWGAEPSEFLIDVASGVRVR
jgi:hypothetical protein